MPWWPRERIDNDSLRRLAARFREPIVTKSWQERHDDREEFWRQDAIRRARNAENERLEMCERTRPNRSNDCGG